MPSDPLLRSAHLMSRHDTALLVVDLQEKLVPAIDGRDDLIERCRLLIQAAKILGIPTLVTEQYPKGLGKTVPEIAELLEPPIEKLAFSACGADEVLRRLGEWKAQKVLLCGIESHVCVQQSALDLAAHGFRVYIAADAVGSRGREDKKWALRRMSQAGICVTTAESAVFEWTQAAGTPEFKQISQLIKDASKKGPSP